MARVDQEDYTRLSERVLAGTGIGTSPEAIAGLIDIQRAVYQDQPQDTAEALGAATVADGKAVTAQSSADAAQASATTAGTRADQAYALAGTKVTQDVGPSFAAPSASVNRAALPAYSAGTAGVTYTPADVQGLMDQVAALTSRVAALIVDGRANHSLKN